MKKITKLLVLMLAALLLFASCDPVPEPVPEPTPEPTPVTPPAPKPKPDTPSNTRADDGSWVKNYELDPDHPYDATHYGLFHNQTVLPKGAEASLGTYSIYIPKGFQPKHQAMIILVPDNTTAKDFALSEIGQDWIAASSASRTFAVVFAEPQKTWNVACAEGTAEAPVRNDADFINDIFGEIRKKEWMEGGNAFLSVDKNGASLLGYAEGANMAAVVAASYPVTFANTTLIEPTVFDSAKVAEILARPAVRHPGDEKHIEDDFLNKDVTMPMYVYGEGETADAIVACWTEINANAVTKVQDSSFEKDLAAAKKITDKTAAALAEGAQHNGRYLGYAGGTLRTRPDYSDDRFDLYDGVRIRDDEKLRRFRTYTPAKAWTEGKKPLVVVLHGSSSAITDICEESRWTDIAEEVGFEVVFIQGYPKANEPSKRSPNWGAAIPSWNLGDSSMENDDIRYILEVVNRVTKLHDIDTSRIYLTGHSLGAMMINTIMNTEDAAKIFAAFAPIGAFSAPVNEGDKDWFGNPAVPTPALSMPVYGLMGEWEFASRIGDGNDMGLEWAKRFGIEEMPAEAFLEGYADGKYKTWTFKTADGTAPVKITQVMDSPHTYMAEESRIVWDWFKDISRNTETLESVFKK